MDHNRIHKQNPRVTPDLSCHKIDHHDLSSGWIMLKLCYYFMHEKGQSKVLDPVSEHTSIIVVLVRGHVIVIPLLIVKLSNLTVRQCLQKNISICSLGGKFNLNANLF